MDAFTFRVASTLHERLDGLVGGSRWRANRAVKRRAMGGRTRRLVLVLIMAALALVVAAVAIFSLYTVAFEEGQAHLVESAQSQARLIESIAKFNAIHSAGDHPGGAGGATLRQITDAYGQYEGFGETGEFTLAMHAGDQIVFLLRHRHSDLEQPQPVPFDSKLAQPMRRALSGDSGSVVAKDYRGVRVLAAHEPVAGLDWGIVAKIDLAEIRAPFVKAGLTVGGVGFLVILFGVALFFRVSNPLITDLEESEQRSRLIVETALDGHITADAYGVITGWNPQAESIFGWSREEVVGKLLHETIIPPSYQEAHQSGMRHFLATGEGLVLNKRTELTALHRDGHEFPVELRVSPFQWQGAPLFSAFVGDITARKQAEEVQAALLHAHQEEAEVAAALARMGKEMVSSLHTSALLEQLCKVSAQVLHCDASYAFLWRPDDDGYALAAAYAATPHEQGVAPLVKVPRATMAGLFSQLLDDSVAQVSVTPQGLLAAPGLQRRDAPLSLCLALRRDGKFIGVQVVGTRPPAEPFTPRQWRIARGVAQLASMALENAQLTAQANEASRLKSEFVASISHELRTPLSVILGYTDLMLDGQFGLLTTDQVKTLRQVSKSADDLLQLISATLDMSRLEKGQVPVVCCETDPFVLLREIVKEAQKHWEKGEVSLRWDVAPEVPILRTDPEKLKVVLNNLIVNATKFTDRGSVSVSAQPCDGGVEFSVVDTGIGIPPENLSVIFEPFRQGDSTTTRRHGGVGLGLYIASRLLDVLGGKIAVESKVGRGSTFRVWIPSPPALCTTHPAPVDPV